jgi:dynein light intermediate chain
MTLQEKLDDLLYSKQARDTGICPIREELHSQVFDELIRELVIECEDRGLILLRIRDQIRMSIAAYQTLYHTSVAFGTRKTLQAENAVVECENKLNGLVEAKTQLQVTINELENRSEAMTKKYTEEKEIEDTKLKDEVEYLKKQQGILKAFVQAQTKKAQQDTEVAAA